VRSPKTLLARKMHGLHYVFTKVESAKEVETKIKKVENKEKLKNDET
jgi:hypothetical protein